MAALTREANDTSMNRAVSPGAEVPIKQEEEEISSKCNNRRGKNCHEGLAPNMPNQPAYLSGWDSDILCHLYDTRNATTILHQMAQVLYQ